MTRIDPSGAPLDSNLRFLRSRYALSKRAFCRLTGISPMTLACLESGCPTLLTLRQLRRICIIYETDLESLCHKDLSQSRVPREDAEVLPCE